MSTPMLDPEVRNGTVQRFVPMTILFHWVYALSWLTLLVTGLGFAFDSLTFLAGPTARLVHRGAALVFMGMPIVYFLVTPRHAWFHIRETLTWRREDFRWLAVAIPYHFSGKPKPPAAGFLNAGQKLNYLVVIATFLIFTVTGLIMWLMRTDLMPAQREVFRWSAMLHSLAMFLAAGMFMIHIYMSGVHPFTKGVFRAMVSGYVSLKYALHEHPRWAEKFVPRGAGDNGGRED